MELKKMAHLGSTKWLEYYGEQSKTFLIHLVCGQILP